MTQMAMTHNFVRLATDDEESDFLEYRQLEEEKIIKADEDDMEYFYYTTFRWYNGYTLSCRTEWVYDLYRVYDKWKLICESEDEVIELPECDINRIVIKSYERLWEDRLIQLWEWIRRVAVQDRQSSKNYELSVVVPLYKSELFMCRTIDSILSSSLKNIELILINDGSPDNSLQIAKRYADNYGCVKVIDKANSWPSDCRNIWMDIATWEYLAFCDSDDIIHPYMYENLYKTCKKNQTDICISSVLIRTQPWKKEWSIRLKEDKVCSFDELMSTKTTKDNLYFVWVRNKIVKRELARKVRFIPFLRVYEDIAYTWSLYSYIDTFSYCTDAIYTRDQRKRNTEWTLSTRAKNEDNTKLWKDYLYWATFPLYNKSWNHLERHDYTHFHRLIEAYAKVQTSPNLRALFDIEFQKLINELKLYDNRLIIGDSELFKLVQKFSKK